MKRLSALAAMAILMTSGLAFGETYALDPVHSFVLFRIKHMEMSWTYGRINAPEGTVVYDPAAPEKSTFQVTLKAENVDTGVAARDNHLKSPTFFNAKEMPTITFTSTAVKKVDDTHLEVTGNLTLHGVTRPVTATLERSGMGIPQGAQQAKPTVGFETTFMIKRSDYGMKEMLAGVGDDVRVTFALEAGRK